MTHEEDLAAAFVGLTDTLVADYDVTDLLYRLVEQCVGLLEADEAGLLLTDQHGKLHVMASSDERTRLLELFQVQVDEGPCLECFHTGEPVHVPDLQAARDRWPTFVSAALEQGYISVHALPLRLRSDVLGALNLFRSSSGTLSMSQLHIGQALADVATIAILQERAAQHRELVIEQLEGALTSRVILEQAKGVLAASGQLEMDEAFVRLRTHARRTQSRLTAVALDLIDGKLDAETILADGTTRRVHSDGAPARRPSAKDV